MENTTESFWQRVVLLKIIIILKNDLLQNPIYIIIAWFLTLSLIIFGDAESMVSGSLHLAPTNSFFNDGENDLGQVPHHILLVRGLDPLTTEETLYAATSQMAALRRVLLIKDRASRMSWGFAFLDYHDIQVT